jgi:hypothetical protein
MPEYNGGWSAYPDRVTKKIFFRADDRQTKTVTILSGQILKAHSFLETNSAGKAIAHTGLTESNTIGFNVIVAASGLALTSAQTLIINGLTFTAGSAGATPAQLATAWAGITSGMAAAAVPNAPATTVGVFSGTFTAGFMTEPSTATSIVVNSTVPASDVTNIAAITGTGAAAATLATVAGTATFNKIAGVLLYDVDASAGDVDATVYTEASFWASALNWATTPDEVFTKVDGTTIAFTAYNTGCEGTSAASNLLKQKFVENSEFEPLGFLSTGEQL